MARLKKKKTQRIKNLTKAEKSAVSRKIRKLRKEGNTQKQAVGEALSRVRQASTKKKRKKRK